MTELIVGAVIVAVVAKAAYDTGYKNGQNDLLRPNRPATPDELNRMLMKATLPLWRRVIGRLALILASLSWIAWMYLAVRMGGFWWAFLLTTTLSLITLGAGFWVMEWFWKPFRDAQAARDARKRESGG